MSLPLIPTSNVDLHNRPPPNKTQKNHPPPPSPCVMSSSPLAASLPHVAPALFVCGCCVVSLPLVVTSRPVALPCHATSLRCVASLIVPLVSLLLRRRVLGSLRPRVLASSRCRVLSCLVVVSRPLTHLVTPALFDCCVVALHLVVRACLSQRVNLPSCCTMSTLTPLLLIFRRCRRSPASPLPSVAAQHPPPNAIAPPTCLVIVMPTRHRHGI